MSILLAALLATSPATHVVDPAQTIIHEASALVAPCREAAEAYFDQQGLLTYQWTASHKSRGNVLLVDGNLRLQGGKEVQVSCWLTRRTRLGKMQLEITEK